VLMADGDILLLFAPTFQSFGCDIGREFLLRSGGGKVHGLCAGYIETMEHVQDNLGHVGGQFWHLNTEEKKWIEIETSPERLAEIDSKLGIGVFGRILVADRRVGQGFVRGGLCRPDSIAKRVAFASSIMPQRYVLGLVEFLNKALDLVSPSVVFCYAVAGGPAVALAEVCSAKGIPFTRLNDIRIRERFVVDGGLSDELRCVAERYESEAVGYKCLDERRDEAKEILRKFRDNPEPPWYTKDIDTLLQNQKALKLIFRFLLSIVFQATQGLIKKQNRLERMDRQWFNARILWRRISGRSRQFSVNIPKSRPYIFYPLHVDPEASTMVQSPWHTDQVGIIEALAKSAPADCLVVVKEHNPMLGKRPRGFYRAIAQIPRVILVGPEHSGLSLIKGAKLISVITGTAAFEAMLLGKPALVIGASPFLAVGQGMFHEPCLAKLPHAICKAMSMPSATDEALEKYLAACLVESFEMSGSLLWGTYESHSKEERRQAVEDIVDGILKRMQETRLSIPDTAQEYKYSQ